MGEVNLIMEEYNWEQPKRRVEPEVCHGDVRIVTIPVKALFVWSDKIVTDWDEDGRALDFTSGYIIKVLNDQTAIYKDQPSTLVGRSYIMECDPYEKSGEGSVGNSGL